MKRILVIEDFSCIGNCSLTSAIPILSAQGHNVCAMPSALLSTQTGGISGYTYLDLASNMMPMYKHWKKVGITFDCVYVGFLGTEECCDNVEKILKEEKKAGAAIIVDPAMADNGKLYSIFNDSYAKKIMSLCKYADLITPNFTEAKMLADLSLELEPNESNASMMLNMFRNKSTQSVVITGVEKDGGIGIGYLSKKKISFMYDKKVNAFIHGAGDVFASMLVGKLLNRYSLENSAKAAMAFIKDSIDVSVKAKADLRFGLNFEKLLPDIKSY